MNRRWVLATTILAAFAGSSSIALAQDGAVSIYTAHKAEIIERLIPEFEAATGLKAEIVKAGSGDIINRVKAEAANPQADVIWSIGGSLLEANQDLLEPYEPAGSDMIDDAYRAGDGWIPYTGILTVFVVNTEKLSEDEYPKTWLDLADPRFEGQISSARADKSGSSYIQLATVLGIYGNNEEGWSNYSSIFDNFALSESSGAVPRFVNDGEATVGHHARGQCLSICQRRWPGCHRLSGRRHLGACRWHGAGQRRPEPGRRQGVPRLGGFCGNPGTDCPGDRPSLDPYGREGFRRPAAALGYRTDGLRYRLGGR